MSYILNALRKSEQDRQQSHAETLENQIQFKQLAAKKKTPIWLIILVTSNLVLLLYFAWSFGKQDSQPIHNAITLKEARQAEIKPKSAAEIKIPAAAIKKDEVAFALAEQQSIAEQIRKLKTKPQQKQKNPKLKDRQTDQEVKQVIIAEKPVETRIEPTEEVVNISKPESQAKDIPFLTELDYDFSRTVPAIDINVYVYTEKKQDRFIMIDMKKYLTGQQIASGMTLKEIRLDSLVVEYKNRVFQIRRK